MYKTMQNKRFSNGREFSKYLFYEFRPDIRGYFKYFKYSIFDDRVFLGRR